MALIACPECGRQVSSAAPACPQCGYPVSGVGKSGRVIDSNVASKAVGAIGGWLIFPWIARLVAVVVFGIAAIVMFSRA
jgi:uncharacterized membrane protein YvbJ